MFEFVCFVAIRIVIAALWSIPAHPSPGLRIQERKETKKKRDEHDKAKHNKDANANNATATRGTHSHEERVEAGTKWETINSRQRVSDDLPSLKPAIALCTGNALTVLQCYTPTVKMVMTCIGRYSPIPSSRLKVSRSQGFKRLEDLSLRPLCLSKKRVSETAVCDAIGLTKKGVQKVKRREAGKSFVALRIWICGLKGYWRRVE